MPLRTVLWALPLCLTLLTTPARAADHADRHGDPLPPAAVTRLGTMRLRHGGVVNHLAFSPDGKIVAASDTCDRISLWDCPTGKERHHLVIESSLPPKATLLVQQIAFTSSGKQLAVVYLLDRSLYLSLYDVASGERVRKNQLAAKWAWLENAVVFSPDGKSLAWSDDNRAIHLWDVAAVREQRRLERGDKPVHLLAFTPDGKSLVVGSGQVAATEVCLRDRMTGQETGRFGAGFLWGVPDALTPDGKHLLTQETEGTYQLRRLPSGEVLWSEEGRETEECKSFAFAPRGEALAVVVEGRGKKSQALKILDAATGKERRRVALSQPMNQSLAYSPDGKVIALGGYHRLLLLDARTGEELPCGAGHDDEVDAVAFCLNGEQAATASRDGTICLWETAAGKERRRFPSEGDRFRKVRSFGDKYLALMDGTMTLRIWDVARGEDVCRREMPGVNSERRFSHSGELPVWEFPNKSGRIRIWSVLRGETRPAGEPAPDALLQPSVSPGGRYLAVMKVAVLGGGPTRLYDLTSGTARRLPSKNIHGEFTFSPDDRTLTYLVNDSTFVLVETATGEERGRFVRKSPPRQLLFPDHPIALAPDGRCLALGNSEGDVVLYDPPTGRELARATGHRGPVTDLAFSPDGKRLLSGGWDTTGLVWDVDRLLPAPAAANDAPAEKLNALWADLAGGDAARAYRAIHALRSAGPLAVRLLAERLRPIATEKERRDVGRSIADLDSEDFATREAATRQLEKLGGWAEAPMRARLAQSPPPEQRRRLRELLKRLDSGEALQTLRAVEALEMIGSAEARAVLETLAKEGEPRLARDARASLARLAPRRAAGAK